MYGSERKTLITNAGSEISRTSCRAIKQKPHRITDGAYSTAYIPLQDLKWSFSTEGAEILSIV
jgi:hypothetical protein